MKRNKDLQFCMDNLKSLQNRSQFEPEQKRALEVARRELGELWRESNPTRLQVYRVVRRVAEAILRILNGD